MEITSAKDVNIRTLSWAIFKATRLNLGGWNNPGGIPQAGSLAWSKSGGLTVTCPDDSLPATVAEIEALIAAHDAAAPAPRDFPAEPPVVPPPNPAIVLAAAADDVVAALSPTSGLTNSEKRNTLLALIAKARL